MSEEKKSPEESRSFLGTFVEEVVKEGAKTVWDGAKRATEDLWNWGRSKWFPDKDENEGGSSG